MGTTAKPSVIEEEVDGVRRRRRWSTQEKLQIVLETLDGSVSVPVIARHCQAPQPQREPAVQLARSIPIAES